MKTLYVFGSINTDLSMVIDAFPRPGETLTAKTMTIGQGGKGANQAIAAARLGFKTHFIGAVGADAFGVEGKKNLEKNGIDCSAVQIIPEVATGSAFILLKENDNEIIVNPGANYALRLSAALQALDEAREGDYFITQLEVPASAVEAMLSKAREKGLFTILNPSPIQNLTEPMLKEVSLLVVNEVEAEDIRSRGWALPAQCVITEGKAGCAYQGHHYPAYPVKAQNTVGAGDTFLGALAFSLSQGKSMPESLIFAQKAAALKIARPGTQGGMPTREEVERFQNPQGK
jgi:ribokinase